MVEKKEREEKKSQEGFTGPLPPPVSIVPTTLNDSLFKEICFKNKATMATKSGIRNRMFNVQSTHVTGTGTDLRRFLCPGQVRSGQVRVFNVYIQSKLLSRTPVTGTGTGLRRFLFPGQVRSGQVRSGQSV